MSSPRSLVYDAPTRLFHWLFAGSFVTAFTIANLAEHSPAFPLHMLAGLLMAGLVVLRVLWGTIGTRHARFSSFTLSPRALIDYFRGVFTGRGRKWPGHNPASSWAALLMISLAAGLAITGWLMASGNDREAYEEVHEVLANSFLTVVLLHVAGIVLHAVRHRDAFARSMVDGRKHDVPEHSRIQGARPFAAVLMLGLVFATAFTLWNGYDPRAGTLDIAGTTLQLGENEQREDLRSASVDDPDGDDD